MATPKLDQLCIDFVKRLPDQLVSSTFTPGSGPLPNAYNISATSIIDYVNRGLLEFFNVNWTALQGNIPAFINMFPELQSISNQENLINGTFNITSPYLDFFKIIGAKTSTGVLIKPKPNHLYLNYLTGKYKNYIATNTDPAIFQVGNKLIVFPNDTTNQFIFHYVKLPLSPATGTYLIQDGTYDSPFYEQWHKSIVDIAYSIYLAETVQATQ